MSRIAVVERNILRLGIHELRRGEVPPKVVIDEAVRLAHWFGGTRAPGFVNGVLDGSLARAAVEAAPAIHREHSAGQLAGSREPACRAAPRSICSRSSAGWRRRATGCGWCALVGTEQRRRPRSRASTCERVGGRNSFALLGRGAVRRAIRAERPDILVEDVNKLPLFLPVGTDLPFCAIVPHLFGTTAFEEASWPIAATVWLAERPLPWAYRRARLPCHQREHAGRSGGPRRPLRAHPGYSSGSGQHALYPWSPGHPRIDAAASCMLDG